MLRAPLTAPRAMVAGGSVARVDRPASIVRAIAFRYVSAGAPQASAVPAQVPGASENASDFPESSAIARSQSRVAVFSLTFALKTP